MKLEGEVLNIGLFFTKIKLEDTDDEITLPNNIFIIKTIRKINPLIGSLKNKDNTINNLTL